MGCNCKQTAIKSDIKINENEFLVFKILKGFAFSILLTCISPIILILIWIFGMNTAFNGDMNVLLYAVKKYKNHKKDIMDDANNFNSEDYELADIDVIK